MIWRHIRDIILLPGMVTVLIPYWICNRKIEIIPGFLSVRFLALLLFFSGLYLFTWTVLLFHRVGKGTLAPWTLKHKLVKEGPYKYCRNPMICGVLLILISESLFFQSPSILVWAGLFFILNTIHFILNEEPYLKNKFGEEYRAYQANVPRWIPKLK